MLNFTFLLKALVPHLISSPLDNDFTLYVTRENKIHQKEMS